MSPANKGTDEDRLVQLFEESGGNVSEVARVLGLGRSTVYHYVSKLGLRHKPIAQGKTGATKLTIAPIPKTGIQRYLFTCIQNNTKVNLKVWENILALSEHWNAEVHVSRFTYNKHAYGKMSVKPGTEESLIAPRRAAEEDELWFDPAVTPYLSDSDLVIAPGLQWCGRMNTLPTAHRPLTGFETHTGSLSGIFPHVKLAVQSIPTGRYEATKILYTTGTVGLMNYVQKRAGIKAEHHHSYGALLVEVNSEGDWWVRQLHAGPKGEIYDLDVIAEAGVVKKAQGKTVAVVNWGDIHLEKPDAVVSDLYWRKGGVLDQLKPDYQFFHDTFDPPRSHHAMRDPHELFDQFVRGRDGMQAMCERVVSFLNEDSYRKTCTSVVVNSNHDNMIERWLREADYKADPPNALFFLRYQLAKYEAIANEDKSFYLPERISKDLACRKEIRFLREDESMVLYHIQFGQHGHLGANGARGSAASYAKMGRRANRGHDHSCSWIDGILTAGITGDLDQGYNKGMSSWSHTLIVTYRNGRRALVTVWKGKHKA